MRPGNRKKARSEDTEAINLEPERWSRTPEVARMITARASPTVKMMSNRNSNKITARYGSSSNWLARSCMHVKRAWNVLLSILKIGNQNASPWSWRLLSKNASDALVKSISKINTSSSRSLRQWTRQISCLSAPRYWGALSWMMPAEYWATQSRRKERRLTYLVTFRSQWGRWTYRGFPNPFRRNWETSGTPWFWATSTACWHSRSRGACLCSRSPLRQIRIQYAILRWGGSARRKWIDLDTFDPYSCIRLRSLRILAFESKNWRIEERGLAVVLLFNGPAMLHFGECHVALASSGRRCWSLPKMILKQTLETLRLMKCYANSDKVLRCTSNGFWILFGKMLDKIF